jgi:hypothetical protein
MIKRRKVFSRTALFFALVVAVVTSAATAFAETATITFDPAGGVVSKQVGTSVNEHIQVTVSTDYTEPQLRIASADQPVSNFYTSADIGGLHIAFTGTIERGPSSIASIDITGTATSVTSGDYKIIVSGDQGVTSKDLRIEITSPDQYTLTVNNGKPINVAINTGGLRTYPVNFIRGNEEYPNFPLSSLDIDGAGVQEWNNLKIEAVQAQGKTAITVSGIPASINSKDFTLNAYPVSSDYYLPPKRFTISVQQGDYAGALESITFPSATYYYPIGVNLIGKTITFMTSPSRYNFVTGNYSLSLTPAAWNGMRIDTDSYGEAQLHVNGAIGAPGDYDFTLTATSARGDIVTSGFKIVGKAISTAPGMGILPDNYVLISDSSGNKRSSLAVGDVNIITFPFDIYLPLSSITVNFTDPDGYPGALDDITDNAGSGTVVHGGYEVLNNAIRVFFTPTKIGTYSFNIIYMQGSDFYREVRALRTGDLPKGDGNGSGCDAGAGIGLAVLAFAALATARKRG